MFNAFQILLSLSVSGLLWYAVVTMYQDRCEQRETERQTAIFQTAVHIVEMRRVTGHYATLQEAYQDLEFEIIALNNQ